MENVANARVRGFEVAVRYEEVETEEGVKQEARKWSVPKMPERATSKSAGYDFVAAEGVIIPSVWQSVFKRIFVTHDKMDDNTEETKVESDTTNKHRVYLRKIPKLGGRKELEEAKNEIKKAFAPTLVHTGIKAYMQDDEVLKLYNRSSNPGKLGLVLANGVGVVDSDYYGNESNDGEIMFAFYNFLPWVVKIKRGDKLGQGVFEKYYKADEDTTSKEVNRQGGFGSTDEQKEI